MPVLASPANAFKTNDTSPSLSWNLVTNAAAYEVQWSKSSTFAANVQSMVVNAPTTSLDLPVLPNTAATIYYWRVRTLNNLGVGGAFSTVRNFTLDITAPNVPVLSAPQDSTTTSSNPISFIWLAVTGAFRYELRYGTSNPPNIVIADLASTSYTPASALLVQDYYWQVRAIDAAGNASDWSILRSFKLTSANTDAPLANSFNTSTPSLFWSPIDWSSAGGFYQAQVDNNNNFASPEYFNENITADTASITTTSLQNGIWYWRVRLMFAVHGV